MASYNRIKACNQAPVGTIMPWGGSSGAGSDGVPPGWIVLNQSQTNLDAAEYPLLARIIGNLYGPFPSNAQEQIGLNIGIIFEVNGGRGFPYNPSQGKEGHDPTKPVDKFNLPNLNQIAVVDLESTRISSSTVYNPGNPNATPPVLPDHRYNNLLTIGQYLSPNGSAGVQAPTEDKSNIDLTFGIAASSNLAGRITGITMEPPVFFSTVYVLPRKLGIDHTPRHRHKAASASDSDQFYSAFPNASPVLEFVPGQAIRANSVTQTSTVTPASQRSVTGTAHQFNSTGLQDITWYDQQDGGISMVLTDSQKNIGTDTNNDGVIDTKKKLPDTDQYPGTPATTRQVGSVNNSLQYNDDYSGVAAVAADAHTGCFPPPGRYNGKRNYYASPDIVPAQRGSGMPMSYIDDMSYTGSQPINTNVPPLTGNTFSTTLNHDNETWAGNLRSHNHDAMEVSMSTGLSIPTTLLVNDVSTGTTNPVTQQTALTIAVNPNTPSCTMMYIMRAF